MCGRVRLSSDYSEIKIKLKFDLDAPAPNFERDWNLQPTRPMLVAIRSVDGKRTPKMMRWGLLPHCTGVGRTSNYAQSATRTSAFPKLRPSSMPMKAAGAFSIPSTMSSR